MKKVLGISLVAVLAATPLMANADPIPSITKKGTNGVVTANTAVATTSYVQGAYNDLAGHINTNITAINANTSALGTLNGSGEGSVAKKIEDNAATASYSASGNYDSGTIGYAIQNTSSAAIAGLDSSVSQAAVKTGEGANGNLALSVTEENGVITAISGSIAAETYDAFGAAATAESNAKTYAANGANLNANSVPLTALASGVQTSLGKANSAVQSVTTGATNGTVSVDGTEVSVYGLGSAAYENTGAFDASGAAAAAQTAANAHADQRVVPVYGTWDSDSSTGNATLTNAPANSPT